jgi:hypothetical protein
MRYIGSLIRAVKYVFSIVAILTSIQANLFAKGADEPASSSSGSGAWVWSYMIILLVVGLGMIAVCKSSGRRERSKPESYGADPKLAPPKE